MKQRSYTDKLNNNVNITKPTFLICAVFYTLCTQTYPGFTVYAIGFHVVNLMISAMVEGEWVC